MNSKIENFYFEIQDGKLKKVPIESFCSSYAKFKRISELVSDDIRPSAAVERLIEAIRNGAERVDSNLENHEKWNQIIGELSELINKSDEIGKKNIIKVGDIVKLSQDSNYGYEVAVIDDSGRIGIYDEFPTSYHIDYINDPLKVNGLFDRLLNYDSIHECSSECMGFGDVTMFRNFGPLKRGSKFSSIWFFLEESKVQVWINDSLNEKPDIEFEFKLSAIGGKL